MHDCQIWIWHRRLNVLQAVGNPSQAKPSSLPSPFYFSILEPTWPPWLTLQLSGAVAWIGILKPNDAWYSVVYWAPGVDFIFQSINPSVLACQEVVWFRKSQKKTWRAGRSEKSLWTQMLTLCRCYRCFCLFFLSLGWFWQCRCNK